MTFYSEKTKYISRRIVAVVFILGLLTGLPLFVYAASSVSDDFESLADNDPLSDDSDWDVDLTVASGVMTMDQHDDHSNGSQVVDMTTTGTNVAIFQTTLDTADTQSVSADFYLDEDDTSGNEQGVILRGNQNNFGDSDFDGYGAFITNGYGADDVRVTIDRIDNDTRTTLETSVDVDTLTGGSPFHGTVAELKLEVDGNALAAYVDDVLVVSANDDTYPAGQYVGIYQDRSAATAPSQPFFDNFAADITPGSIITLAGDVTFSGDLDITGSVAKGSGTFVIDHPLDPANKLLYHSFVESPDAKNIYDGVATLDESGEVTIILPSYFEALNKDFRYQFLPIGTPMPNLHISSPVSKNTFTIAGGVPGGTISWQVTGNRHDAYIAANPIIPEVEKSEDTIVGPGEYLYPEGFGGNKDVVVERNFFRKLWDFLW